MDTFSKRAIDSKNYKINKGSLSVSVFALFLSGFNLWQLREELPRRTFFQMMKLYTGNEYNTDINELNDWFYNNDTNKIHEELSEDQVKNYKALKTDSNEEYKKLEGHRRKLLQFASIITSMKPSLNQKYLELWEDPFARTVTNIVCPIMKENGKQTGYNKDICDLMHRLYQDHKKKYPLKYTTSISSYHKE